MSRAFRHAKNEIRAAQEALQRMRTARDFDGFEIAWRDLLAALEKAWVKVERVCKSVPGFQQWQRSYKSLRDTDELLRYVYHARHLDQHTVHEVMTHTSGSMALTMSRPNEPLHIKRLIVQPGQPLEYEGSQPLVQTVTPPRVDLAPVNNRGTLYPVPRIHLGKVLITPDPIAVAELSLQFYARIVDEAERAFGGQARA